MLARTVLYFVAVTSGLSAASWIRLTGTYHEVFTDAGERRGREILSALEQARLLFGPRDATPVRVVLFARERDYAVVRPGPFVPGFAQTSPDRDADYIAILAEAGGRRIALHEYIHLLLNHNAVNAPRWLSEGLSDFYSTISISGGRVRIGNPVDAHLQLLRRTDALAWLTFAQMQAGADKAEQPKVSLFYAQSWALVHMLNMAPRYRGKIGEFVERLNASRPEPAAFQESFGMSLEQAMDDLRGYLLRPLPFIDLDAAVSSERSEAEVRSVTPAEVVELEADLLLLSDRTADAEALYRKLAKMNPSSPKLCAGRAALAMRAGRPTEALALMRRAIELGASDGAAFFEYAMLLRDTGADVTDLLRKAVAASPSFAQAHFLLGERLLANPGSAEGIEHLRRAAELRPGEPHFWHGLAFAYFRAGDAERSREAAARCRKAARTPQEIEMADAALRLSEPGPKLSPGREVTTPAGWNNPKGDARIEGRLTQVDCGKTALLRVGNLVLEVADPDKVVLRGTRGIRAELRCGPQDMAVAVEYVQATKRVTMIEFRQ